MNIQSEMKMGLMNGGIDHVLKIENTNFKNVNLCSNVLTLQKIAFNTPAMLFQGRERNGLY